MSKPPGKMKIAKSKISKASRHRNLRFLDRVAPHQTARLTTTPFSLRRDDTQSHRVEQEEAIHGQDNSGDTEMVDAEVESTFSGFSDAKEPSEDSEEETLIDGKQEVGPAEMGETGDFDDRQAGGVGDEDDLDEQERRQAEMEEVVDDAEVCGVDNGGDRGGQQLFDVGHHEPSNAEEEEDSFVKLHDNDNDFGSLDSAVNARYRSETIENLTGGLESTQTDNDAAIAHSLQAEEFGADPTAVDFDVDHNTTRKYTPTV